MAMVIHKYFGIDGAAESTGVTVVIDIFRAATTAAYLLGRGVDKVLPVATKEEAFLYKKQNPDCLLVGEEHGIKIEGFDLGNSPYEVSSASGLKGKTAVHRSSAGTQGVVNATGASEIIFGSFATCSAVAGYIEARNPMTVSIVAMDGAGSEDDLYADYLIAKLTKKEPKPIEEIVEFMRHHPGGWRFLDPNNREFPEQDFYLCLSLDAFDFAPVLRNGFIERS